MPPAIPTIAERIEVAKAARVRAVKMTGSTVAAESRSSSVPSLLR
jgi:hypothetical protein